MILSLRICLLLIHVTARTNAKTTHEVAVHDQVLPLPRDNENGFLTSTGSLPDWSDVERKSPYYIEVLLVVDAAVARYYGHELERIRAAMLTLMYAVNMYAFQLDIRITVVDVVLIHGHNVTLEQFMEWRHTTEQLPTHDLAILVRHRYEGGVAYVNGVCKRTAVGITGFFPEAPYEYASVFFHELSHLLGLSHTAIAKCHCPKKKYGTCLRIDGFDNECSAQALVDLLPSIECLMEPLQLPPTVLALCGNGVVENDEDCDCGPLRYCINALCEPRNCRFIVAKQYLYTMFTFGTALTICGILVVVKQILSRRTGSNRRSSAKNSSLLPHKSMSCHADLSPIELPPSHIDVKKCLTTTMISSPSVILPMANVVNTSLHPVPKPRILLTLDSEIPVSLEPVLSSDYVPMNPPKGMGKIQSFESGHFWSVTPHCPKTSGTVSSMTRSKRNKPSQVVISPLDDVLSTPSLNRQ